MAVRITKNAKRKDLSPEDQVILQGLDPEETVAVNLTYHNTGIEWDRQAKTLTIKVGEFNNGYKIADDEPLTITTEVQPPIPPDDELDLVTGEVIREAGSEQALVPRLSQLLSQPLPPAIRNQTTYQQLLLNLLKANDLLLKLLRPEYAAGTDVVDTIE